MFAEMSIYEIIMLLCFGAACPSQFTNLTRPNQLQEKVVISLLY